MAYYHKRSAVFQILWIKCFQAVISFKNFNIVQYNTDTSKQAHKRCFLYGASDLLDETAKEKVYQ